MDSEGFGVDFRSILEWILVSFVLTVRLGRRLFLDSFRHLLGEFCNLCVCVCVRVCVCVCGHTNCVCSLRMFAC